MKNSDSETKIIINRPTPNGQSWHTDCPVCGGVCIIWEEPLKHRLNAHCFKTNCSRNAIAEALYAQHFPETED